MSAGRVTEDRSTAVHAVAGRASLEVDVVQIVGTSLATKAASITVTASGDYGSDNTRREPPPRQVKQV